MQAEANILERVAQVYMARRGVRLPAALAVLSAAVLLFLLAGGFPPFAWRLFAQTLPELPALLALRGSVVLLAMVGLALLSLTILLAWWGLLWLAWRMLSYWRYEHQEMRRFASDMAEAQYLAEDEEKEGYAAQHSSARSNEEAEEAEYALANTGTGYSGYASGYSSARSRSIYALTPLALEEQEEDPYEDEDQDDELGFYQDEEDDKAPWAVQEADVALIATQPPRPARLMSAPAFDQRLVEYPTNPIARPASIPQSNSVHTPPAASAVPLARLPHLTTTVYDRIPLPTAPLPTTMPETGARPASIQLVVSTGLDVGLTRKGKPNEDSLLALQNTRTLHGCTCPVGLFVIADGMGGHENGQEASRLVIQSLSKSVVPSIIYGPTDDNYMELLAEGAHRANLEIYQRNRQEKVDMGTTLATALIVDTTAYMVNAGDSRVYLYRPSSGLSQVTRDHSTVARLVESGVIKPEDVYTHPRRNEIYRSLGHRPSEELDKFTLALQPEDLLLLCSDGLWEMVRDAQIQQIIASTLHQPAQISSALVQAALDGGGKDNISVITVRVKAVVEDRDDSWLR